MNKLAWIVVLMGINASGLIGQEKTIGLEDIWKDRTFHPNFVHGIQSLKDGLHYTTMETPEKGHAIVKFSYVTGQAIDTLWKSWELTSGDFHTGEYVFSPSEDKILIASNTEFIYRHSSKSTYWVYDMVSKKMEKLQGGEKEMYATFDPTGTKVAYVLNNDLYYKNLADGKFIRITHDGKINSIINGAVDWVYEEEFSMSKGFEWNVDGSRIAYYRFDETDVKQYSLTMYGELYPQEYKYKYPKVGENNSKVQVAVYDLSDGEIYPAQINASHDYIARIKWTKAPDILSLQTLNRHQDHLNLVYVDPVQNLTETEHTDKSDTYLEVNDHLHFLGDMQHFIWMSEQDGYNHLYMYTLDGDLVQQLTKGAWDVTDVYGVDEVNGFIYYQSAEASPMERHIYKINFKGEHKTRLDSMSGWSDAYFSSTFAYAIIENSSFGNPSTYSLLDASGKFIRNLEDNADLKETISKTDMGTFEFFSCKAADEKTDLNGYMIKPKDFDKSKKYPVLMHVYGGPGAQTVKNQWGYSNYIWHQMLSQKGYIVVSVDGRGTGGRGKSFRDCTYMNLGKIESEDQIAAANYLKGLNYVDANRLGIWGWSYGGFMSSICLFKAADLFKMGIAVAPVSNWKFYDSIYTERYMRTTEENPDGYNHNAPIHFIDSLKGKYLLVHGMADDNVHAQNSYELMDALIKANKQFDLMLYPNKDHSIYGGNTRLHLYKKMTDYILDNL